MKKNNGKVILSIGMVMVMGITGFKLIGKTNRNNPYNNSSIQYTTNMDTKFEYDFVETEINNYSYDDLKQNFEEVLNDKNFGNNVNSILSNIFESLYQNYDAFYEIYEEYNVPTKFEYMSIFIKTIEEGIDSIKIVDVNDVTQKEDIAKLGTAKGRFITDDKLLLLDSRTTELEKNKTLLHEITHANQKNLLRHSSMPSAIRLLFIEGEATFSEILISSVMESNYNMNITVDGEMYKILGVTPTSNALYSKYYNMLLTLTDYNNMEQCKKEYNIQNIVNNIKTKYNVDASKMLLCMDESVSYCNDLEKADKVVNNIKYVEQIYCQCLIQEAEKISSIDEFWSFVNRYRHYKMQFSLKSGKYTDDFDYIDTTGKNFPMYNEIENIILSKSEEYNAVDKTYQKEIFDFLFLNIPNMDVSLMEKSVNDIMISIEGETLTFFGKNSSIAFDYNYYDKTLNVIEFPKETNNNDFSFSELVNKNGLISANKIV